MDELDQSLLLSRNMGNRRRRSRSRGRAAVPDWQRYLLGLPRGYRPNEDAQVKAQAMAECKSSQIPARLQEKCQLLRRLEAQTQEMEKQDECAALMRGLAFAARGGGMQGLMKAISRRSVPVQKCMREWQKSDASPEQKKMAEMVDKAQSRMGAEAALRVLKSSNRRRPVACLSLFTLDRMGASAKNEELVSTVREMLTAQGCGTVRAECEARFGKIFDNPANISRIGQTPPVCVEMSKALMADRKAGILQQRCSISGMQVPMPDGKCPAGTALSDSVLGCCEATENKQVSLTDRIQALRGALENFDGQDCEGVNSAWREVKQHPSYSFRMTRRLYGSLMPIMRSKGMVGRGGRMVKCSMFQQAMISEMEQDDDHEVSYSQSCGRMQSV